MILVELLDPRDEEVDRNLKLAKEWKIEKWKLFDESDP